MKSITTFHGKPEEDLDDWLFSMERYFRKTDMAEESKVDFAVDYLRENARTVYRSLPNYEFIDWYLLKAHLTARFQPINHQTFLRQRLSELKQTGSVQE